MAKKRHQRKTRNETHPFDVYKQADGALVVLAAGDEPETDSDPVWSGEAENEAGAIAAARKSSPRLRKAPAANPEHDPDVSDEPRKLAEKATNERLGITTRPTRKRKGAKKRTTSTAKSGARKSVRGTKKGVRKSSRR